MKRRTPFLIIAFGFLLILLALTLPRESRAAIPVAAPGDSVLDEAPKPSNAYCLLCHAKPDQTWKLPSGETVSLTVDASILAKSVHGDASSKGALVCADCHGNYRYPHPVQTVQTLRQFTLTRYATCRNCHEDQYTRSQDSVHGAALRAGRPEAAVCVDCHGGHDIQPPNKPRERISLTCGKCHGAIFDQYRNSVHGKALFTENNPDVPTCIDCHGVHNIQNPTTAAFRVRSPDVCSKCHSDEALMAKYKISTHIQESYLTDFHGSTVTLFEQQDPKIPTNKAVCFDCHGVHNIQPVKSGNVSAIRDNLLTTCRQCHPDATVNFPDAWIGHYPATPTSHPILFTVDGIFRALLPVSAGVVVIMVGADFFGRLRQRFSRRRQRGA